MPNLLSGRMFIWLNRNLFNSKMFFLRHKYFFEIFFLSVYGLQQFLFVVVLYLSNFNTGVIAIYIAILVTTVGFERTLMNSRYSNYKENMLKQMQVSVDLQNELKNAIKRNKEYEFILHRK